MRYLVITFFLFVSACATQPSTIDNKAVQTQVQAPSLQRLSDADISTVSAMLVRFGPYMEDRKKTGSQALLTFDELYQCLTPEETRIVRFVEGLKPQQLGLSTPFAGYGDKATPMVAVKESFMGPDGVMVKLPVQYLPVAVNEKYQAMMAAMEKDLGRRLYLASGHRSGAYQLYLYLSYLKKHGWSIMETGKFVALPGYSEHGTTDRQALDFMSVGASIDDEGENFEKLPEYSWLQKNAGKFGFVLSYPRNSPTGITFEPWHWHYEPS